MGASHETSPRGALLHDLLHDIGRIQLQGLRATEIGTFGRGGGRYPRESQQLVRSTRTRIGTGLPLLGDIVIRADIADDIIQDRH